MKLYGSVNNRLEENRQFCGEIKIGTGMTEYHYSDRDAYEVIAVRNQKHVTVRQYDHKLVGEAFTNEWELISIPRTPETEMVKRGDYWYSAVTISKALVDKIMAGDDVNMKIWLAMQDINMDTLNKRGKVTKYHKMNVSFGIAYYYYDYEF